MDSEKKLRRMDREIDELRTRIKDSSQREVLEDVFDTATLMALYELSRKGYIDALGGSVSSGKEANIFHAISKREDVSEVAVKIYLISTANFNAMKDYIIGDPRFIGIKHTRKDIILAWAKKEFKNLKRAYEAGIRVPMPYITNRNILIMEFIGEDGIPMPQLKNTPLSHKEAERIFNRILEYMNLLYTRAKLVHADLSEYNILVDVKSMEPVIIDMGQSVLTSHMNAEFFLKRDISNISRFFTKFDVRLHEDEIISAVKEE